MSCCGNHNNQDHYSQENHNHGDQSVHKHGHILMMAICFIIPVAVITGLFFTGGFSGSGSLLIFAAVLICPFMHLFMMTGMMKKGNGHHH